MFQGGGLHEALQQAFLGSAEGREQIAFFADLPDTALEAGFSAWWREPALLATSRGLPVELVPVSEYRFVLDVRWQPGHQTMNDVRSSGSASRSWRRAMAAGLERPVILARRPDRWTVLDGYHRLLKADVLGHRTIRAVRLPKARIAEALVATPFFGDLNRLWLSGQELLLEPAREVARQLRS